MPTYEEDLITRARELQRLATRRRKLRRQLKAVDVEIRQARKALSAVRRASEGRRPDVAPSRLTGGATGYAAPDAAPRAKGQASPAAPDVSGILQSIGIEEPAAPDVPTRRRKAGAHK